MRRKTVKRLLYAYTLAAFVCCAPAAVSAETDNSADVSAAEAEAQTNDELTEEKVIRDVSFFLNGKEYIIGNRTDKNFDKAAVVMKQLPAEGQEEPLGLLFVDDEGIEHTFEGAEPGKWSVPILVEDLGFLYIQYLDEAQANQEIAETGEEKELDEKTLIHVTTNVNVRSEANVESAALQGAAAGAVFTAVGSTPGWVKVEVNGSAGYGYISHKFVAVEGSVVNTNTQNQGTVSGISDYENNSAGYSQDNSSDTGTSNSNNNTAANNTTDNNNKDTAVGDNNSSDSGSDTNSGSDSVADVDIPDIDFGESDSVDADSEPET